jgi:hypothetical protein
LWFQGNLGKNFISPLPQPINQDVVTCACYPCYAAIINKRTKVQEDQGIKQDLISKITKAKSTGV